METKPCSHGKCINLLHLTLRKLPVLRHQITVTQLCLIKYEPLIILFISTLQFFVSLIWCNVGNRTTKAPIRSANCFLVLPNLCGQILIAKVGKILKLISKSISLKTAVSFTLEPSNPRCQMLKYIWIKKYTTSILHNSNLLIIEKPSLNRINPICILVHLLIRWKIDGKPPTNTIQFEIRDFHLSIIRICFVYIMS